jgi:hypothetical protein
MLFADDTNIISYSQIDCFQNYMNHVFACLNKWIKANKLTLNYEKPNIKFCTNNRTCFNLNIGYDGKSTEEVETTKFRGLKIDSNLNW